jgi:hypothetical protein
VRRLSFAERAERLTIAGMVGGILVIALSRLLLPLTTLMLYAFQAGLALLVVSTLLQIAVGNLPKDAGAGRSLRLIALILLVLLAVFALGIALVPILSQLGRQ